MTKQSKDWEEEAVETKNDEVLEDVYTESTRELLQVKYALQRIQQEEYDKCEQCREEINPKHLKIMPHTTLCIKCVQSLEYQHKHA